MLENDENKESMQNSDDFFFMNQDKKEEQEKQETSSEAFDSLMGNKPSVGEVAHTDATEEVTDNTENTTDKEPEVEAPHTYSYVYSNGNMNNASYYDIYGNERKKKREPHIGFVVLAILLSFCLLVGGAVGGYYASTIYANYTKSNETENGHNNNSNNKISENVGENSQTTVVEDKSYLYNSDPDEIVKKQESEPSIYGSAGDDVFTVSQAVREVADAVVVIQASTISNNKITSVSAGSGVIISESGYILTCNHVIDGANKMEITLNNGNVYQAELVGKTSEYDLAVIKITPVNETLDFVTLGCSKDLVAGETVIAIGNPLGTLGGTVSCGIISATERNIQMSDNTIMTLIQTDTSVNSGNSGGGLFNLDGELIGIVNAKVSTTGVEGIAFAIPIDTAYTVLKDIIKDGYVHGIIDDGLTLEEIDESSVRYYQWYYGANFKVGLYVLSSSINTELKNGDRIITVNGVSITTESEFKAVERKLSVGDTLTIEYVRSGTTYTTTIVLQEYIPSYVTGQGDS